MTTFIPGSEQSETGTKTEPLSVAPRIEPDDGRAHRARNTVRLQRDSMNTLERRPPGPPAAPSATSLPPIEEIDPTGTHTTVLESEKPHISLWQVLPMLLLNCR